MKITQWCGAILAILSSLLYGVYGDFEYLVSNPESIVLKTDSTTVLLCEMNIEPDKFQWKFYPLDKPYDAKALINLASDNYKLLPSDKYSVNRKKSELQLQVKGTEAVGDYQCLAYYGALVVASVPWRITLERMEKAPVQNNITLSVQSGNTLGWRCDAPKSNPEAYVDYKRGNKYVLPAFNDPPVKSLILRNVTVENSGIYGCTATNGFTTKELSTFLKLDVLKSSPARAPYFTMEPKKEYTVTKGSSVFLECAAIGQPIPTIKWSKKQSRLPVNRMEVDGGLIIKNITSNDDGVYICTLRNSYGILNFEITVRYNEEPTIKNCSFEITDIIQGEDIDIVCQVQGTPEPQVSWLLNGFSVLNDSAIEAIGNKIYFRPVEKRHAGNLQVFARNIVKTVYRSISIRVIPLSSSFDDLQTPVYTQPKHSRKQSAKMIPPSRPIISRLNDETVMVRWSVPNNNGLPIQLFKVQYKEIEPANHKSNHTGNGSEPDWNTANTDIAATVTSYSITELKSNHYYKFRVLAIYSNNHWKKSPNSKKFHLQRLDFDMRNPLPVCSITYVKAVNHTAVNLYWNCPEFNVSIHGFFISYMSATRAGDDYIKTTVEGGDTRNFTINYLQPDTTYDFKLQSFTSELASEFSPLMKGKTGTNPVTVPTTVQFTTTQQKKANAEKSSVDSNIYIVIAGVVIGCALVITAIVVLFVCRKWKKNKLTDNRDKPASEHHIQSDVDSKTISRSNGCVISGNKITITANPLADAENKNPNVIEMRNLANNNIRHQQESPMVSEEGQSKGPAATKEKTKKSLGDAGPTGSNYV